MDKKQEQYIKLRSKKLGLLLFDARVYARRTKEEAAAVLGITVDRYQDYESGQQAPSLPEIEILAYFYDIPVEHFWSNQSLFEQSRLQKEQDMLRLLELRRRIIAIRLRQIRTEAGLTLAQVAETSGLAEDIIAKIESGETPATTPELEILCSSLKIDIKDLFDLKGPIGEWRNRRMSIEKFNQLPTELQDFISRPVNHPYLELAIRLSDLSVEKLRTVAEGLLEITY